MYRILDYLFVLDRQILSPFNATIKFRIRLIVQDFLMLQNLRFSSVRSVRPLIRKFHSMKTLFDLAIIWENIPSTSAQIERFFSITGIICDKKD